MAKKTQRNNETVSLHITPMLELTTRLPLPIAEGIIELATLLNKSPGAVMAEALTAYYITGEPYKPLDQPGRRVPINYTGTLPNLHNGTTDHHTAHDNQLPPEPAEPPATEHQDEEEDSTPVHEKPKKKKRARARKHWTQRPENKAKLAATVLKGHRERRRKARLNA